MLWKIKLDKIKLISPNLNAHWTKRRNLSLKIQKMLKIETKIANPSLKLPANVTLCRIAPRIMDDDNLQSAFKGIRDGVAMLFFPDSKPGQKDNCKEIIWIYEQKKGASREYAIEITIDC
jgi:hypothetical protein